MSHSRAEIEATVDRYVEVRKRIDLGELAWDALAQFFTDDAVYIDPAWGRIEGIEKISKFFVESMVGLEDWSFPIEFTAIDGDQVMVKWLQITPGSRADGSRFVQSGVSTLIYAGDGRFSYEEDLLNMVHVLEDLRASRWRPHTGFNAPPAEPERDFSRPDGHNVPPIEGWPDPADH
ncbi:MAG TPA: nuclear transport factor 2 family protein [Acidimicrobiales bacterium]|jgi:ketosteroid isomerase-like protein